MHTPKHRLTLSAVTCIAAFALAGCSSASPSSTPATTSSATSSATAQTEIKEVSAPSSRLALTYDGGLMVLDGKTFEVLETIEKEGFLRLNPAGDNRHMVVADGSSYTMLDMGAWTQEHGDHDHYYTTAPTLTSLSFAAEGTGHVIVDYGKGAMFADKTGTFDIYNPAHLTGEDQRTVSTLETTTVTLPEPHHGLAIPLEDDRYLVTVGNDEERSGAAVVDAEGKTIVENKECPGIHGEAVAADGIITVGCQDGALIYKDGAFTKVSNPEDPYSRSGNQVGSKASHFVLADYKTDKEAELERPEQFSVIDTDAKTRTKVALPEGNRLPLYDGLDSVLACVFSGSACIECDTKSLVVSVRCQNVATFAPPAEAGNPGASGHLSSVTRSPRLTRSPSLRGRAGCRNTTSLRSDVAPSVPTPRTAGSGSGAGADRQGRMRHDEAEVIP